MPRTNVEAVRAGYEAFNRRDFEAALDLGDDSITWRPMFSVETDVLRGRQEILAAWQRQVAELDVRVDIEEMTDLDETHVLVVGTWRGRGPESGAPVEQKGIQVFTFEGGLIRGVETYASRAEAEFPRRGSTRQ